MVWNDTPVPSRSSAHRGLALLDAELEQFAVDTRSAPERVVEAHPSDQTSDFVVCFGASGTRVIPIASRCESLAMPFDHGPRLDKYQAFKDL
jgi:hypothetical protein